MYDPESRHADQQTALANHTFAAYESAEILTGLDAKAANSFEDPNGVIAQLLDAVKVGEQAHCTLPPLSFVVMTLRMYHRAVGSGNRVPNSILTFF